MIALVARRAFLDYARRPLNLVLLVVVPVVLVVVWSGTLADYSKLLGGIGARSQIEAATAGWAAAAVAGLAGFFQASGSRAADRRLAAAGTRTGAVATGRLLTSCALALLAAAGGLLALAARDGIRDPARAISVTILFALIYLMLGILIGTLVRTEMNGALLVTLAWVFDVFFGPGMGAGSMPLTRLFPLHFPTLVLTSQASGHAGPIGDLGWSVAWAAALSVAAVARLLADIGPAHPTTAPRFKHPLGDGTTQPRTTNRQPSTPLPPANASTRRGTKLSMSYPARPELRQKASTAERVRAGIRAGSREYRRNRVLWAVLVVVPVVFIALAISVTPTVPGPIALVNGGKPYTEMISMRRIHAATMVPITSAFLAGLTGLFMITGSASGDRRLMLAGFRRREVLAARMAVVTAAAAVSTLVAVAVSGAWYPPRQWAAFIAANMLVTLMYAMIGILVGPHTGRLGGLYLILLLAFVDVGLGQTIMFGDTQPTWGAYLPSRGPSRLLIDSAFTTRFDETAYALLSLAWLLGLTAVAAVVFHRGSQR